MKKLMIAAAIVCAAAFAQAATYNWQDQVSTLYSWTGAPDWNYIAGGTTAYIFFTDAYSQAQIVDDFAKGGIDTKKVLKDSTSVADGYGAISQSATFSANYTEDMQVYYAIVEDGHLFISNEMTAKYNKLSASPIAWEEDQTYFSDIDYTPIRDASAGYDGAGWYAAAPEPTSGLLLLLGMAGLALKRKRA